MANKNLKLHKAKKEKNDEFYTSLEDIALEVKHYWPEIEKLEQELKRKVRIWANCDDEKWSMFTRFFKAQTDFHPNYEFKSTGYQLIPNIEDINISMFDTFKDSDGNLWTKKYLDKPWTKLDENGKVKTYEYMYVDQEGYAKGDFRAKQQGYLWQWADIIITNPPFSLFREFMDYIVKYNKKFLLVSPQTAIHYKEIIPIIVNKNLWLGINSVKNFKQCNNEIKKLGNVSWFTNLKTPFENRELFLTKNYYGNEKNYNKDKNTGFINIDKTKDIPYDYKNEMLVPDSFMTKYNENQFEIFGCNSKVVINGIKKYSRLIIKNKNPIRSKNN